MGQTFVANTVIGDRYRLVAPLGRGAMGEVWRAEHVRLGSSLALKLIDPALLTESDADVRRELFSRFEREARAAATLESNHVVRVTDHGFDGGVPYIAMELLQGETLADRLERQGRLSWDATLLVVQHVARALARAHEAGIVHRDLKPDNVFLVRTDDGDLAKVLDFGIAKLLRSPLDVAQGATSKGQLLGTPLYMSPEQASGSLEIDHRTDLWALAVIAFECLTGRLPFVGNSIGDLVLSICARPLPVPSQVEASLPGEVDAWWARAAARERDQRFGSALELAEGLRAALGRIAPGSSGAGLPHPPSARVAGGKERRPAALETQSGLSTTGGTRRHGGTRRYGLFLGGALLSAAVGSTAVVLLSPAPAGTSLLGASASGTEAQAVRGDPADRREPPGSEPSVVAQPTDPAPASASAETSADPLLEASASASAPARPVAPPRPPRAESGPPRPATPPAPPGPTVDPRLGL